MSNKHEVCDYCERVFNKRGISGHQKNCDENPDNND